MTQATEADHHDWLLAAARRAHRTADACPVVVEAVRRTQMDAEYTGLDTLLTSTSPDGTGAVAGQQKPAS
jgi:hypothetical protein